MRTIRWLLVPMLLGFAPAASASFHFMQIEQVIGGVDGDTTQQAIQLRTRAGGQNLVSQARVRAFDAAGGSPVLLVDMGSNVPMAGAGVRILIATAEFAAAQGVTPDFIMTSPIPPGYLAAGRITFEQNTGTILWSLSWGGAGYTGSNAGDTDNDANGDFGPPFANALPSASVSALLFTGPSNALSTTNLADYGITKGPALFTNNAGESEIVFGDDGAIFLDGFETP